MRGRARPYSTSTFSFSRALYIGFCGVCTTLHPCQYLLYKTSFFSLILTSMYCLFSQWLPCRLSWDGISTVLICISLVAKGAEHFFHVFVGRLHFFREASVWFVHPVSWVLKDAHSQSLPERGAVGLAFPQCRSQVRIGGAAICWSRFLCHLERSRR